MLKYAIGLGATAAIIVAGVILTPTFSVTATLATPDGLYQTIVAGTDMTFMECLAVKEKVAVQLESTLSVAALESVECVF